MRVLTALVVGACVLLAGCGGQEEISGKELSRLANEQLEKQNPEIVPGKLVCDDVPFEKGATTRCLRIVDLSGREVRIGATVEIDRVEGGGHFQVDLDTVPKEFGLTGDFIEKDLATQYEQRFGEQPDSISCPYLKGKVGTEITCKLKAAGKTHDVVVTATEVDPEDFDTDYTFTAPTLGG